MSESQQYPPQPTGAPAPQHVPAPQHAPTPQGSGAPQYPAAPAYGAPQYPAAPAYGAPAAQYGAAGANVPYGPTASGDTLGRTAFLIAIIAVGIGFLWSLATPFVIRSGNYDVVESVSNVSSILLVLAGAAALVTAIIALRRPAPHLMAAIAVGLAGSTLAGRLVSWLVGLVYLIG
ncbi:MAG: hypothetical protein J7484_05055 [Microbacterium sp.]|nr:hypothetical protein [Microbacterium sp.]